MEVHGPPPPLSPPPSPLQPTLDPTPALRQVASKLVGNEMKARRIGYIPADEGVEGLGLLTLPADLEQYIAQVGGTPAVQ